ncbi:MAG: sel1 repeat family protein [Inquilinus sp.]|nr:sel1 repeat family protein [Inquilinus sp.]
MSMISASQPWLGRPRGLLFALAILLGMPAGALPARAGLPEGLAAYDQGDYRAALAEWLPLAEAGNATAQGLVGLLYRGVPGIPADPAASARWYRSAAEQGNVSAQYNTGLNLAEGRGVPRDPVAAFMWLDLAAAGQPRDAEGGNAAARRRDRLAATMDPAAIAEARRQAVAWRVGRN